MGVQLTNKTSTLMADNYMKLLQEIQIDLSKWDKLQLSFMGRIATVKMNVLPRVLFQTIPVILKNLIKSFTVAPPSIKFASSVMFFPRMHAVNKQRVGAP